MGHEILLPGSIDRADLMAAGLAGAGVMGAGGA